MAGVPAFARRPHRAHQSTRGCKVARLARGHSSPAGTLENAVVILDGRSSHPRRLLGNKGYGIDTMRRHGLPVPPAFCITTDVGVRYLAEPAPTIT